MRFAWKGCNWSMCRNLNTWGSVLGVSGRDDAEYRRNVASGRKVAVDVRSLVNARDLQRECARALHEILLVPVLLYSNETMIWQEKENFRLRSVQVENLKILLDIKRMDSPEYTDEGAVLREL